MRRNTTNSYDHTSYSGSSGKLVGFACELTVKFYERNAAKQLTKRARVASIYIQGKNAADARAAANRELTKQLAMDGTIAAWTGEVAPVTKPYTKATGR